MIRLPKNIVLVLICSATACGGPAPDAESTADTQADTQVTEADALVVYTTNYPLAYFAERIGGELVRVEFPVPSGIDPAYCPPA